MIPQPIRSLKSRLNSIKEYFRHPVAWVILAALLVMIFALAVPVKNMMQKSAREAVLGVSAYVLPRQELKILFQTPSLVVTESDIDRGYLEIPEATRVYIHDNDRSGYVLLFEGLGSPFKQVVIRGLNQEIQIAQPAAYINLPYSREPVTATLNYHFDLIEGTQPGVYSWPLTISFPPAP